MSKSAFRQVALGSFLASFGAYGAPALAQQMPSGITVEMDDRVFELVSEESRYSGNEPRFQEQPWWGDAQLAQDLAGVIKYRLGNFTDPFTENSDRPSALIAYGEGDSPLGGPGNSDINFVSVAYWDETGVVDCPNGCPVGAEEFYYVFSEHVQLLLSLDDISGSLVSTSRGVSTALHGSSLMVHGLHGRPLSRLVATGEKTVWIGGDYGRRDNDGRSHVIEVGVGYHFDFAQINASVGRTSQREDMVLGGEADGDSSFIYLEAIKPLNENSDIYATVGGFYQSGEMELRRGYDINGEREFSQASPDTKNWGVRARIDWVDAVQVSQTGVSPYVDLSHRNIEMDGYTESEGSFPAVFEKRDEGITEARVGTAITHPLAATPFDFVGVVEVGHRFDDRAPDVRGELRNGLFTFDLDGEDYDQTWVRAELGIEGDLGAGKMSLMINGTSEGEMESAWVSANYQVKF